MLRCAIVILNFNGKKWLEQFLPAVLQRSVLDHCEVIVADNASTDDSVAWMQKQYPKLKLMHSNTNLGYAGGYEYFLNQLEAEYFILLNSDVEPAENWLAPLLQFMDEHPKAGACQPKIKAFHQKDHYEYAGAAGGFIDFLGYPFCRGRILETIEEDKGQYDESIQCHWASGACLVVRSKAYREAGGLDSSYFAHMEEIDLCWRLRRIHWEVWCYSGSSIYHVGGGTLPQGNSRKTLLNFRNNLCMLFTNLPGWQVIPIIYVRLILDGLAAVKSLIGGNAGDVLAILKAHFAFYARIPALIRQRKNFRKANPNNTEVKNWGSSIVLSYFLKGKKVFSAL